MIFLINMVTVIDGVKLILKRLLKVSFSATSNEMTLPSLKRQQCNYIYKENDDQDNTFRIQPYL